MTADETHSGNDGNSREYMQIIKGSRRHKETWCWNNEVAEAVKVKKALYRNWRKERSKSTL